MISFVKSEVQNRGFNSVVVGISGGLDSAVVAAICKKAFSNSTHGIIMPSSSSSSINFDDALDLCKALDIPYNVYNLSQIQNAFLDTLSSCIEGIRMGNLCARLRMTILYDYAYDNKSLVIGTSNKSEIMLGYGTIYGDLAYAINPIGNIYKSDLFKIAKALEIPQNIIDKKPSADFYENQSDEAELGYSYDVLDEILKQFELGFKVDEIIERGFIRDAVLLVDDRINKMYFKRQMPLIAKLQNV